MDTVGPDKSGKLTVKGKKPRIEVIAGQPHVRQRFTMAHELGHLVMHEIPEDEHFRHDLSNAGWREVEANAFAAQFLVPLDVLEEIAPRLNYSILTLADEFDVSEATMSIRIAKLRTRQVVGF